MKSRKDTSNRNARKYSKRHLSFLFESDFKADFHELAGQPVEP